MYRLRSCIVLVVVVAAALVAPPPGRAERPNIDRVVVHRADDGRVAFRIVFARAVVVDPDDHIQVAIDADRDPTTGVDGLDYSLDQTGPLLAGEDDTAVLLTAVDGEPVASSPPWLRFRSEGEGPFGVGATSVEFSIPVSELGGVGRFDFYVFVRAGGALDEAPSHVLFSAGSSPWTYPKDDGLEDAEQYPLETYVDGSDVTLSERPGLVLAVIAAMLAVIGALLALGGWSIQRLRAARRSADR